MSSPRSNFNKEQVPIRPKSLSLTKMEKNCSLVSHYLKSLSHPQRLMILGHLTQGEKTVTELQELCDISQSQLSQFLARMKLEGLIHCERKGRYQAYRITNPQVVQLIESIHKIFCT